MPTNSRSDAARLPGSAVAAGAVAFAVLATLNAGGYRYGVADQAFYIPAIRHELDPSLFPRDWPMLGAQGRFFLVDEIFGTLVRVSGLALPVWFAVAQLATLAVLYGGGLALGRAVLRSPWALTAWMAALTLRHRIAKTGANTLESYFHPRMLVFGLGLTGLALFLRGHPWWALALAIASGVLHPTTGALFVGLLMVATLVGEPSTRAPAAIVGGLGVVAVGLGVATGVFDVQSMDPPWLTLLATKDYVFPTRWSSETWLVNLLGPAILAAVVVQRMRRGLASPRELGVAAGGLALVAGFLLSLPFIARGTALAIQLQTSRVFWPVEAIAVLSLVWWLVEWLPGPSRPRRAAAIAGALVAVSLARGVYVGVFETPERPLLAATLPDTDWTRALDWVREHTPADAFVLADPGHAWKPGYGVAVRIGAERDVYLEETKDVAMAMYSRAAAERVRARLESAAAVSTADAQVLTALARHEGLTHLVVDRDLDLPVRFISGAIRVYEFPR